MTNEGDFLKVLRKYKKMTQKQFSEYLEIPLITLAQWECGKRTPPNYVLKLIQFKVFNDTDNISIFEVMKNPQENYLVEIVHPASNTRVYSRVISYQEYMEFELNYWYVEYIKNKKGYKVNYYLLNKI